MIVILKAAVWDRLKPELAGFDIQELEADNYTSSGRRKKGTRHNFTHDGAEIDMTALTKKEAEKLLKILDETNIHGSRVAAADVRKYLKASKEGVDGIRARSCRQAAWLLELFFAGLPHNTVFSKDAYGGESHSGYWVGDVQYHPEVKQYGRDRYEPECVIVDFYHVENDWRQHTKLTLFKGDCHELTCQEILEAEGYVQETPKLMEKLRKETERYYAEYELVGTQYVAKGLGIIDLDNILEGKSEKRYSWRPSKIQLDKFGETRVVIDVFQEGEGEEKRGKSKRGSGGDSIDIYRWHGWNMRFHSPSEDELVRHLEADDDTTDPPDIEIPVHPLVPCFDLRRHARMRIHINNLTPYEYNKSVADRLVLPERDWKMVNLLVDHSENVFEDIVSNKGRSMNILATGVPGVGKTCTAEIFSEFKEKPLYTVQCAQLGLDAEEVEKNLGIILQRATRWSAIVLLDEADVYIRRRESDLNQNAIVGAFLRVLEYASCILFMTTNLEESVDDAISSRCIAKLHYESPTPEDQGKIWKILADLNKLTISDKSIDKITKAHPKLTGRDVKNILKLSSFISDNGTVTFQTVEEALVFKPTQ